MTNFVQVYKSTDLNAPVLTGQVGTLITLLNKCLVDGYTTASVSSITRSGTTVTVNLAVANTTLESNQYLQIAGASEVQYNGIWLITVVSSTQVTFQIGTTPSSPATGTITYAKAPLQWTKAFAAGTNAQAYRSADATSNQFYLQVIDNGATAGAAKEAQVFAAEVMSADQVVTSGRFPTTAQATNGLCCRKSTTADSTARAWTLWGDDRTFYLCTNTGDAAGQQFHGFGFGHFLTFKAGDGFNTFVCGSPTFNSSSVVTMFGCPQLSTAVNGACYLARSYSQTGGSIAVWETALVCSNSNSSSAIGSAASSGAVLTYPNPVDSGLYVVPMMLTDSSSGALRGRLPGWYAPLHINPFSNYDESTGITGLSGVTLMALSISYSASVGQLLIDKYGPWT
jgi:hypothetical protein